MLVSQSPLAVDRRECQEAAVADSLTCPSPSRSETSQKLRCLSYAPGHLNLTFTSLLISSFLQSPVLISLYLGLQLCCFISLIVIGLSMSMPIQFLKEMLISSQREKGFDLLISSCLSSGLMELPDPGLVSRFSWWAALPVRRFVFQP